MPDQQAEQVRAVRVALRRMRTAGEVRFIKDRGSDKAEWAWGTPGPSARDITDDATFDAKKLKPLAATLRATLMAMGHAMSAQATFAKIKSADISPDGNLGGKGYIQKIADMRRQFANVVEALSANADTIHDELKAPHWNPDVAEADPRERDEVKEILDQAEDIEQDPEGWAADEESEEAQDQVERQGKTAGWGLDRSLRRLEAAWIAGPGVDLDKMFADLRASSERLLAEMAADPEGWD